MASPINALSSQSASQAASSSNSITSAAPSEEVFLQLLVAQIQNQDPLNPTDSTQFVSQLAQFSELEQVIAMRGDLDSINTNITPPATTTTGTTSTGSGTGNTPATS